MDEKTPTKKKSMVREYTEALLIALVVAMIIRMFVMEAFKIPSGSMLPTLLIGDHLLVSKVTYKFVAPKRGDVVVFKYPDDPSRNFIKRVIALDGDTVEIQDKVVFVNGIPQTEPYIQHLFDDILPGPYSARDNLGPIEVPPQHYFMLGDNRDASLDSRFWDRPFVSRQAIVGKALLIYWSWKRDDAPPETADAPLTTRIAESGRTLWYYLTHLPGVVRWERIARNIQ
jgi:signal peptidase I